MFVQAFKHFFLKWSLIKMTYQTLIYAVVLSYISICYKAFYLLAVLFLHVWGPKSGFLITKVVSFITFQLMSPF